MNDCVIDMIDKIASQAKTDLKVNGGKTMLPWHLQTATKLVLPGELAKHGVHEGVRALSKFNAYKK